MNQAEERKGGRYLMKAGVRTLVGRTKPAASRRVARVARRAVLKGAATKLRAVPPPKKED